MSFLPKFCCVSIILWDTKANYDEIVSKFVILLWILWYSTSKNVLIVFLLQTSSFWFLHLFGRKYSILLQEKPRQHLIPRRNLFVGEVYRLNIIWIPKAYHKILSEGPCSASMILLLLCFGRIFLPLHPSVTTFCIIFYCITRISNQGLFLCTIK